MQRCIRRRGGAAKVIAILDYDAGNIKSVEKAMLLLGQDVTVIYGMDGLSQFFQDQGFEETSKALDCKYEL